MRTGAEQEKLKSIAVHTVNEQPVGPDVAFSETDVITGEGVVTVPLRQGLPSGELLHDATSCPMCRRMIINAGLDEVVIRRTETEFDIVPVQTWIDEDDSL